MGRAKGRTNLNVSSRQKREGLKASVKIVRLVRGRERPIKEVATNLQDRQTLLRYVRNRSSDELIDAVVSCIEGEQREVDVPYELHEIVVEDVVDEQSNQSANVESVCRPTDASTRVSGGYQRDGGTQITHCRAFRPR